MTTDFQYDVFLSHNQADKPRVRRLAERLRAAGLRVWFDEWLIKAGDDIYLAIEHGLAASRVQVLCLSPAALGSEWVALERSSVLFRDPANKGRRFVPLLLADCALPDTLRRYKYVDFRQETPAAFDELLNACRVPTEEAPGVSKPKPADSFSPTGAEGRDEGAALRVRKPAEQPPAAQPKPKEKKPKPVKPPEQTEPLAVLERKLTGHKDWVHSVAVSPDVTWAASGSWDRTVKIWDLETGQCRATLDGHTDQVRSVAITPDGKRILSGSFDKSVRVWDARSGREVARLEGHTNSVWSVVALRENARAVSGGSDKTLRLWELASGKCLKTIECGSHEADEVFSSAVNPAGTQALSGHHDGQVRLWNLETGQCLAMLKGHSKRVSSVQITPDGRFAVSGSSDQTVKVWNLEAKTCVGTLEGHQNTANELRVAISPDGTLIASTGFIDHTVRLWDWKSGSCLQVVTNEEDASPISAAFSPDGSRLVVGTGDATTIYVYRLTGVRAAPTAEPTRRYVNAKVVLLGEGAVGKTSLAHRLIEDKYIVKDRTHGMNVWKLALPPHPGPLPQGSEGGDLMDREALLWDLAGQEDYRLIHRLFLDETALALLLINPQKDDPFAEAGDWLKALDTAARNDPAKREATKLLIFSQTDVGGMKVSNAKIERFIRERGLAAWLATSAKTGENCSDQANAGQPSKLKQLIADSVPWDKLPWTATPRLLAELKNALLKMRDTTDIRLLRFAELAQRLEQTLPGERFGEADVRTAVSLLANHGLARPLKFGDLVLLQPELLNGYAGAIIRAARANKDEIGSVLEADIYREGFDFTGVDRLKHRPDEELLLRAMVQTFLDNSLCIAEDIDGGRYLVFPSQYRRDKDIPRYPDIFVSYTFSGEWQTVWTTLVVRLWYSREFEHRELWRNAAEFAFSDRTFGLKIENTQGEGTAKISLYFDKQVSDELKAIFIEYVHRHLAKWGCEVSRERRYVCGDCGRPFKDMDLIRDLLNEGAKTIVCQKCRKEVELVDFIERRLKSDPVARKILAMDARATRELDTQALEQILIGHMMAIAGEANQVFRPVTMADYGVDGEVEFRDNDGKASGKKIYVQLKSGDSYLRLRKTDGKEIFDVQNERHLGYWVSQVADVYLVIRQTDEVSGGSTIRWMNLTRYLKTRKDQQSRQLIFDGVKLDLEAVWKVRDEFFPPKRVK